VSKISELRKTKKITRREIAIALDVTETTIYNWEQGTGISIWIERVVKLCEILNCEPKDLLPQRNENINLD
jgi:transcriptional regulator with XRE-family HTH domain